MDIDIKKQIALWIRGQEHKGLKFNLIDYLQEQICKYSVQENTPAEQIKGMNRLLRDIINLDSEVFKG